MKKSTKPTKSINKRELFKSVAIGAVAGLAIAGGVVLYFSRTNAPVSTDYAKAASGAQTHTAPIPVSKELTTQRLSLSKKIQKMDCAVVNAKVPEDQLQFKCKKPTAKQYSRKELLEL